MADNKPKSMADLFPGMTKEDIMAAIRKRTEKSVKPEAPQEKAVLSILIASTVDRRDMLVVLVNLLRYQIHLAGLEGKVKIMVKEDNKEMSIGAKRQLMLTLADSEYICFFDSDDLPRPNYVKKLWDALESKPDCVGFLIAMTTNGQNPQVCCHSLKYPQWKDKVDGYDYVRNVTHFNVVKTELALQAGFKDIRFGEDKDYADRLTPLCKTEVFIEEPIFDYMYTNTMPHNEKYGIK